MSVLENCSCIAVIWVFGADVWILIVNWSDTRALDYCGCFCNGSAFWIIIMLFLTSLYANLLFLVVR